MKCPRIQMEDILVIENYFSVSLPLLYCLTQCWTSVFSNVFSHLAGHYILVHLRQASILHQIVLHLMMSALCLFALF